jgi:hypothetical protein
MPESKHRQTTESLISKENQLPALEGDTRKPSCNGGKVGAKAQAKGELRLYSRTSPHKRTIDRVFLSFADRQATAQVSSPSFVDAS